MSLVIDGDLDGIRACPDLWPVPTAEHSLPPAGVHRLSTGRAARGIEPRLAVVQAALWPAGETIRAKFLDGPAELHHQVERAAQEWTEYADVSLEFVPPSQEADVRISFADRRSSWSRIGTDCHKVPPHQPTMNFGWLSPDSSEEDLTQVVLHEFGHALGCIHEHQHPDGGINWNRPAVYWFYAGRPYFWHRRLVDENIFRTYDRDLTVRSEVDPASIMMYPIDRRLTTDGFEVGLNTALSDTDKEFIRSCYP